MPTKRNTIIAIAKGIAIILVVAGHAEGPEWLTNFIYEFHMPLFFMAAFQRVVSAFSEMVGAVSAAP